MSEKFAGFEPSLFQFLKQLNRNNNRDWFAKNKSKYESNVLDPAMCFIRAFILSAAKDLPFKPLTAFLPSPFTALRVTTGFTFEYHVVLNERALPESPSR